MVDAIDAPHGGSAAVDAEAELQGRADTSSRARQPAAESPVCQATRSERIQRAGYLLPGMEKESIEKESTPTKRHPPDVTITERQTAAATRGHAVTP